MPYTSIEICNIAVTMKKEGHGIREISRLLGEKCCNHESNHQRYHEEGHIYQIQARKTPKNDKERRTDAGKNVSSQPEDDVPTTQIALVSRGRSRTIR